MVTLMPSLLNTSAGHCSLALGAVYRTISAGGTLGPNVPMTGSHVTYLQSTRISGRRIKFDVFQPHMHTTPPLVVP